MNKTTLNYIVDMIMFVLMMAVIGIGFLMKFILITGQERWIKYGRNVEEAFLGLDRHGWGKIHLIIGLILFGVLILHLILHWKAITRFLIHAFEKKLCRLFFVTSLLLVSLLLLVFPFFVKTEITALESGYGRQYRQNPTSDPEASIEISPEYTMPPEAKTNKRSMAEEVHPQKREVREALKAEIEVKGYMSLKEVATRYAVQTDQIKARLKLPLNTPDNERLGRLRQQYGFTMSDVRDAIDAER